MSPRPRLRASRQARIALCLFGLAVLMAIGFAAKADAAQYKMVACAGNNGVPAYGAATNTAHAGNPAGIFEFHNWCGGAGGDPPGSAAHLRIVENQNSGNAGHDAYGHMYWSTPPYVHFKQAGGYTRQPNAFNEGWRSRFWLVDFAGNGVETLTQGQGLPNEGVKWATSGIFGPHLWPFGHQLDFHTFVFELRCVRPAGCDRANYNATDANGFVFILSDDSNSQVAFTDTGSALMAGQWVRGTQNVFWNAADAGSGLRFERLRVDGAQRHLLSHACNTSTSGVNGEWARAYAPCPTGGPWGRGYGLDTASLADGAHNLTVCAQDYAQYQGLNGTGGETCAARTIRVDNSAPGAPSGLAVTSANPQRYLDRFGAIFSLPPNGGSPIAKVHYNVVNAAGEVVKPAQTLSATNPTSLSEVEGPAAPGNYRLRVWLEDQVGHVGPAATAPIPRDTTPPAAPQGISVAAPQTTRVAEGFDLRWQNIADAGAPIDAAHYQVRNGAGAVVVATRHVSGANVQAIESIETPNERGVFTLRLWLTDAEGNVGAPATAPLSYRCPRSPVSGGQQLSADFGESVAKTVSQGEGASLRGELRGVGGDIGGAPLCVFSRVATEGARQFLGIAISGSRGDYRFAIAPGPSRELEVLYRAGQRELAASAHLQTVVKPTLRAARSVVRNKTYARFSGEIPGPRNNQVVIVLQVRQGNGWLAFRRYRTRGDGRYELAYYFRRTTRPTVYEVRAQVRETVGYPYVQGDSDPILLRVLPDKRRGRANPAAARKRRCLKRARRAGVKAKRAKLRCAKAKGKRGKGAKAKRGKHRPTRSATR